MRFIVCFVALFSFASCTKPPPVRLVLLGDTGTGDAAQASVATLMETTCATLGCDAVVLLGDNFYPTGVADENDPQWQTAFETPYANLSAPFLAVLGNHDYGGNGIGFEKDRAAAQVAKGKLGGKFVMPDRFYLHTIGDVDIFVLDTTAILFRDTEDQRAAIKRWRDTSHARWKIVAGHHPFRSNGVHGDAGSFDGLGATSDYAGASWREFFARELCDKVDVYVSGHEHDLDWPIPEDGCAKPELIVSGGGGAAPRAVSERHAARFTSANNGFFFLELAEQARAQVMEVGHDAALVHEWKRQVE